MDLSTSVEFDSSPSALDTAVPRFSWIIPFAGRRRGQSAYRIRVASARDVLDAGGPDVWDSGRVASSQSTLIPYAGTSLASNRDYHWCAEVWDETGAESAVVGPARFSMGLLHESDWAAHWIGLGDPHEPIADPATFQPEKVAAEIQAIDPDPRSPMLRKAFQIDRAVRRARVFVCALGLGELRLNGAKVGHDVLATSRTEFRKRVLYSTYTVTDQLRSGGNVIGLLLGNGWFNGAKKY